jgi:AcrR family transcriptional regulator
MGVKPSALYNHFKSKNEILETLIQELSSSAIATLFADSSMDTGKTLLFNIALTFKRISSDGQNEALYRLLMQEMFRNERIREIYHDEFYQENVIKLSELFFVMMQEKRILSFAPILLANNFLSPLFFYQMQLTLLKLDHKSTSEVSTMFSKHVEFFWDTIQIKEIL